MTDPVVAATQHWLTAHLPVVDRLIVACSGGADSVALALAVWAVVPAEQRSRLMGATIDHGLQSGSADRAAATAELLTGIGYPEVVVCAVTVEGGGGLEAAARRARYAALQTLVDGRAAEGARCAVLLAHTADDQAETVLLGLARGSGPRSIAGMLAWRAPWGRPLLGVSRADTESTCQAAGLQPWHDPHNDDPAFTRVRLRHEVLPLLDDVLGGGVRAALGRTASLMAQDLDALDQLAGELLRRATCSDGSLDVATLAEQPVALRARVLRRWALDGGAGPLTFDHLARMVEQVSGSAGPRQVRIPGGVDVVRTGAVLRLRPATPVAAAISLEPDVLRDSGR